MRSLKWWPLAFLVFGVVVLRIVDIGADAWKDLDWGTGIWTDEGFYAHNARNQVLFGKAEQDGFNNYNLSPVLHAIQVIVFTQFGVGLIQARLISIIASLLTCGFLYAGVRNDFGPRAAAFSLMLLGLESSYILYNRLGLMESLGTLVIALAYYLWTLDRPWSKFLSGFIAAAAFAVKTTFLIFLPAPVIALIIINKRDLRAIASSTWPYLLGAAAFFGLYYGTWLGVHGAEVARMNNFYRTMQSQPRSFNQLLWMIRRAVIGYHFGFLQRMETRSTVFLNLALVGSIWSLFKVMPIGKSKSGEVIEGIHKRLLMHIVCFAAGVLFIFVSRYAPSRYFLVFHVSAAVVGGVLLSRFTDVVKAIREIVLLQRALYVLVFLFGYHVLLPLYNIPELKKYSELLAVLTAMSVTVIAIRFRSGLSKQLTPAIITAVFLVTSLGQYTAWFLTRRHVTLQASQWLTAQVGPNAIVAGDWAPNLGFGSKLRLPPVFKGLANDDDPIQTLNVDFVLTGRTPYPKRMWAKLAPGLLTDENRVSTLMYHGYTIDLYRVPDAMKRKVD
ncbi:MAG: ArnT family glycosyltransferase [Armatimonadaceae bacterium]